MAQTPGGLPYPLGMDLVRDGDNVIQSLATTLDNRGHAQRIIRFSDVVTLAADGTLAHFWPGGPFGATPTVVFGTMGSSGNLGLVNVVSIDHNGVVLAALNVSTTGNSIRSGAMWLYYIAVGPAG